jgi:hypothetical protein
VHSVTWHGTLVIAWASGSQLPSYAWGARPMSFSWSARWCPPWKPPTSGSISTTCRWKTARAQAAYGQDSQAGKVLEIHQELSGHIHIVLIRRPVGF